MKYAITALMMLGAGFAHADFSFEYQDHTYRVVTTPADWDSARANAAALQLNGESGYLAVIESADENDAILSAIKAQFGETIPETTRASDGGDAGFLWIGATDAAVEGVWIWDNTQEQFWAGDFNGAPVNGRYANWGIEPDNAGNQDAGAFGLEAWPTDFGDLGSDGQWNDLDAANTLYYIVEFDTLPATVGLSLEEPEPGLTYSGIGNLRGWAVSSEQVERVEVYVDGEYLFDAPYGGARGDVGAVFPDIEGSGNSGFSLAYAYSGMTPGEHTITVKAIDALGNAFEQSATFTVATFHKGFILPTDAVDFSQATFAGEGDEIVVQNAAIDGVIYDLRMKWRTAEQGLEIVEINQLTASDDAE